MNKDNVKKGMRVVLNHALRVAQEGKTVKINAYVNGTMWGESLWGESYFQIGQRGVVTRVNKKTCTVSMGTREIRQCPFAFIDEDMNQTLKPDAGRLGWPVNI